MDAVTAVEAATTTAVSLGLRVENAVLLPGGGNRYVVRLLPCDSLVRVGWTANGRRGLAFEIDVALALASTDAPFGRLDARVEPRVSECGEFALSFWTYHQPMAGDIDPTVYADALHRLHVAMRGVDVAVPDFRERVGGAQRQVADPAATPELADDDRALLSEMLHDLLLRVVEKTSHEQLLHGEPHPGNLLNTVNGPVFIDMETCCRGPVAFDVAGAPEGVAQHYPGLDPTVLRECRLLALSLATTWRWERGDRFPNGRFHGEEGLRRLRAAL